MADMPSIDAWLREAKADPSFRACGMYLVHNGTVRETPKAEARGIETDGVQPGDKVTGMVFSYDEAKVAAAVEEARALPGIGYVRVWLNSGELAVGDDIMLVLIGGDIRPRDRRSAAFGCNHQEHLRCGARALRVAGRDGFSGRLRLAVRNGRKMPSCCSLAFCDQNPV